MGRNPTKISENQWNDIQSFALAFYQKQDQGHNIDHAHRTVRLARLLARQENADPEICALAGLLHEFHDSGMVAELLRKTEVDGDIVTEVSHCIESCSTYTIMNATTIEAKVVFDADFLQVFGPLGIYRLFMLSSVRTLPLEEAAKTVERMQEERFKLLQTRTGKGMAESLHSFDHEFFRTLNNWM